MMMRYHQLRVLRNGVGEEVGYKTSLSSEDDSRISADKRVLILILFMALLKQLV